MDLCAWALAKAYLLSIQMLAIATSANCKAWIRPINSAFWTHVPGRRAGAQKTQSKSTTPDPVYLILFWTKLLPSMKSMCSASGQGMSIKSGLMFWTCPKSIEQSCYTFEDRSGSRGTGFRTDDGFYLMWGNSKVTPGSTSIWHWTAIG